MYTKIIECCKKQIKVARENVGEDSIWESFAYEIMAYCEDATINYEDDYTKAVDAMISTREKQLALVNDMIAVNNEQMAIIEARRKEIDHLIARIDAFSKTLKED